MEIQVKKVYSEDSEEPDFELSSDDTPEGEDPFADEETDDWEKPEQDTSDEFEKEPTAKDIKKTEQPSGHVFKKQAQLKDLESKKDALLMQLRSGIIGLDKYKQDIGNIPTQIKQLRSDIEKAMQVSLDDEGEEEEQ